MSITDTRVEAEHTAPTTTTPPAGQADIAAAAARIAAALQASLGTAPAPAAPAPPTPGPDTTSTTEATTSTATSTQPSTTAAPTATPAPASTEPDPQAAPVARTGIRIDARIETIAVLAAVAAVACLAWLMPTTWFATLATSPDGTVADTVCVEVQYGQPCITMQLPDGVDGWGIDAASVVLPGAEGPYGPTPPGRIAGLPAFLAWAGIAAILAAVAYRRHWLVAGVGSAVAAFLGFRALGATVALAQDPLFTTATTSPQYAAIASMVMLAAGGTLAACTIVHAYNNRIAKRVAAGGGTILTAGLAAVWRTVDAARVAANASDAARLEAEDAAHAANSAARHR